MRHVTRRRCSKPSCNAPAVSTLTYVYADSTAVVGPLATYAEPHCYDLCQMHSERLTAPLGWEVVRITPDPDALKPSSDDLEALANAVREAARPRYAPDDRQRTDSESESGSVEVARRGHLRVLRSADDVQPRRTTPSEALSAPAYEPEPALAEIPDQPELPDGAIGTYDDPFGSQLADDDLIREPFFEDGLPYDD